MILVCYSIKDRVQKTQTKLPFWADHSGNGTLAAEWICNELFKNANWIEDSKLEVEIHSPDVIAGTYDVNLRRSLSVSARKRAA